MRAPNRRWILAGAASCVVALGVGFAFVRSGAERAPAAHPEPSHANGANGEASSPGVAASGSVDATPRKQRKGGLDVTFYVASDTHLGFETPDRSGAEILNDPIGIEKTNLSMIRAMNELRGMAYPEELGGQVGEARGVLISGDLTEDGGEVDWQMFEALYGLTGKEGPLRYPVFEGAGNHDRNRDWVVRDRIAERHGGRFYSFDFDDLHLVCLWEAPDDEGLVWLANDLSKLEADVPVVLYFHYPLAGPFAESNWFGRGDFRDRLERSLIGYNVLGIFHGHYHASGAYRWRGHDVYLVGSPKHDHRAFLVVHVTDSRMRVAAWNYELDAFWWWHDKPIHLARRAPDAAEIIGERPPGNARVRPELHL